MKRPTILLCRILRDAELQTGVAIDRDAQEIERRFENEGMSFLTIALPSLCDALDRALAEGFIAPRAYPGFKPRRRGGKLPALLAGFFMNIFEADGMLKENPCIASIFAIRQITRFFKKVELPCSPARSSRAFKRYVSNDIECSKETPKDDLYSQISGILWSRLEAFSINNYCNAGTFGTGATAEHLLLNGRWSVRQWPERGSESFPLSAYGSYREDDIDSFAGVEILPIDKEHPVRVVQVPKTLKTPRTISVEPSYMMLRQQSIAKPLVDYLEREFLVKSVRFTDQTVNRDMARVGSIDGSIATIDLSDASDLVSNNLVKMTFRSAPTFLDSIQDCRSSKALMPNGNLIEIAKFASMGSAMCFPIEAMVFYTIAITAMVQASGKRPSIELIQRLSANVSVYGDDIIIPTTMASGVIDRLEAFGLKVNQSKSFTTGLFRESCGGDYYAGHDVTPVYCRQWDFSGHSKESRTISSYISTSNQLYWKGYWNATQYVRDYITEIVGNISRTVRPYGVLTYRSCVFNTQLRWDRSLQTYSARGIYLRARTQPDRFLDYRGFLQRYFAGRNSRDSETGHLAGHGSQRCESSRGFGQKPLPSCDERRNDWSLPSTISEHQSIEACNPAFAGESGGSGPSIWLGSESSQFVDSAQCENPVNPDDVWGTDCETPMGRTSAYEPDERDLRLTVFDPLGKHRSKGIDTDASVRPYALSMKRRWWPINIGIWN